MQKNLQQTKHLYKFSIAALFLWFKNCWLARWWREYSKSKVGVVGVVIFLIMILAIIFVPLFVKPEVANITIRLQPPSFNHILGTDGVGKDILIELIYAGRVSIMIGVIAGASVIVIATIVGMAAGYFGGIVDEILTRFCDILMTLPRLPLMILLAAFLGPGIPTIVFVVVVLGWTGIARQIRAQTLSTKRLPFVEAAQSTGAGHRHILLHHIIPNVAGVIIANFILEIVSIILLEAGLSFLGLGDPLHQSWGMMLYFAQSEGHFSSGAWWYWLPPGLGISLFGCACSFIGTTINDRFVLRLGRIKSKPKRNLYNIAHGTGIKYTFRAGRSEIKPEAKQ